MMKFFGVGPIISAVKVSRVP